MSTQNGCQALPVWHSLKKTLIKQSGKWYHQVKRIPWGFVWWVVFRLLGMFVKSDLVRHIQGFPT